MRWKVIFVTGMAVLAVLCCAQAVLNNDAIIKMVKAGLGDDIVLNTIKAQPGQYAMAADDLIALKKAGVSDKVIAGMMEKAAAPSGNPLPPGNAAPPPAAATAPTPAPVVSEVGVYFNKAGTWADVSPEVVNFKTGGALKTVGTVGIVKGDVNGHLNGLHSPNHLKTPVELLVYTPEGTAITEYQLLRLREQKDSREFRTVTGGVFHASGGATRDLMPFENKKVAPRTYQITLGNLGPGEYGLLPPASGDSSGHSGRLGKIYSFRIIE
ncbi:MAG TPA: hypothetical protein VMH28_13560 [Candidatus Acidoferrales bacterium]|nr:hypothetical protein [Candidatus Acidoferrales bacterium]